MRRDFLNGLLFLDRLQRDSCFHFRPEAPGLNSLWAVALLVPIESTFEKEIRSVHRLHGADLEALGVVGDDLAEDFVEANGDFPVGVVRFELGKV